MPRPLKWAAQLHPIRERAARSRTETWSRTDLERLFDTGRASTQTLMKAIGDVQAVGSTHFVSRAALLAFLDSMLAAESVEAAFARALAAADPPPRPKALRVALPADLRSAMLGDLPENVQISPGRIEITAPTAAGMVEALVTLATVMRNDLDRWQLAIEPPPPPPAWKATDGELSEDLKGFLEELRSRHRGVG